MPDDQPAFDDSGLYRWADEERFEVTRERVAEYAAATNDPVPAHRAGDVAPPVFAIVPVFEAMLTPAVEVMPVELIPRVVHGEQDFHFHRAIRPGDKLVSRAKMIGYQDLTGAPGRRSWWNAAPRPASRSTNSTSPVSCGDSTRPRRSVS